MSVRCVSSVQQWLVSVQDHLGVSMLCVCVQCLAVVSVSSRPPRCQYVVCPVSSSGQCQFNTTSVSVRCVSSVQQWSVSVQDHLGVSTLCVCVQCPAVVSVGSRPPRCSLRNNPTERLCSDASLEQSCDIFTRSLVDVLWPVCQPMLHQI